MSSFVEFLKKTWKFLVGILVAIIGGMLLFKKDESGELIEKTTEAGEKSFQDIIAASEKREKLEGKADRDHQDEVVSIEEDFEKKKKEIRNKAKEEVEEKLSDDNLEKATDLLARELDALNLDKD